MRSTIVRLLSYAMLGLTSIVGVNFLAASPAAADACFMWNRILNQGDSGNDVKQLQIRIAGWMSYGETLDIDGIFGPATANAVQRFKAGYNIASTNGQAGSAVFDKLYQCRTPTSVMTSMTSITGIEFGSGPGTSA